MKFVLIILLLIVGAAAYLLFGPSSGSSSAPDAPAVAQPGGNVNVPVVQGGSQPASSDQPKQRMPMGTSFVEDAGAVAAYGMGHTQVMIKNRTATKVDEINKKQTDQLNKELGK